MIAKASSVKRVYICHTCLSVLLTDADTVYCLTCKIKMEDAGWLEAAE